MEDLCAMGALGKLSHSMGQVTQYGWRVIWILWKFKNKLKRIFAN